MIGSLDAWRHNLRIWVPALVFFLLALGALLFYRVVLADDAELGQSRLTRRTQELDTLRSEQGRVRSYLDRATGLESGMEDFFGVRLESESASLTRIIAEVKALSEQAGLVPDQISYEREAIEEENVLRRSLTFPVEGSYQELRQLINFLELSDSFLILEQIQLRGDDEEGTLLRINLEISTLFLTEPSVAIASTASGREAAR